MAFEPEALVQQPLGIRVALGDVRGRDEPERDHGGARPEAALAWDAVEPFELQAVGGIDPLVGTDAEVRAVGCCPPSVMTSTSFQRSSATAAQSNPAPRLAVVAGARRSPARASSFQVTDCYLPAGVSTPAASSPAAFQVTDCYWGVTGTLPGDGVGSEGTAGGWRGGQRPPGP